MTRIPISPGFRPSTCLVAWASETARVHQGSNTVRGRTYEMMAVTSLVIILKSILRGVMELARIFYFDTCRAHGYFIKMSISACEFIPCSFPGKGYRTGNPKRPNLIPNIRHDTMAHSFLSMLSTTSPASESSRPAYGRVKRTGSVVGYFRSNIISRLAHR